MSSEIREGVIVEFEGKPEQIIKSNSEDIEHPLSGLIGIGGDLYKDFDLMDARESSWSK